MTYDKFPVAGTPVPITVARDDPSKVRIEWDEIPDVDDLIRDGARVFTDPDAVEANLRAAMTKSVETVIEQIDDRADEVARAAGANLAPGQLKSMLHDMRGEVEGGTKLEPTRLPSDQPSARVIAHTRLTTLEDGTATQIAGSQMLLSVSVPGQPRYGYRWKGTIHTQRFFALWSDVPIEVKRNGKIDIQWKKMDSVADIALRELKRANAEMQTKIAGLQSGEDSAALMQQLIAGAAPDPEQRAVIEQQLAQASTMPWANPLAPPGATVAPPTDTSALLEQLRELHAAGALTDDEYAAERQRVLDQI
jgi:hypothetical protein